VDSSSKEKRTKRRAPLKHAYRREERTNECRGWRVGDETVGGVLPGKVSVNANPAKVRVRGCALSVALVKGDGVEPLTREKEPKEK